MQGTQIWNIPIRTTFPFISESDICLPSSVFREKLGALSPGPGTPAETISAIKQIKITSASIFRIANPNKENFLRIKKIFTASTHFKPWVKLFKGISFENLLSDYKFY
jgi:hypothetical protein